LEGTNDEEARSRRGLGPHYVTGDSDHQSPDELTARIVQRLRDAGIGCEIDQDVNLFVLTQDALYQLAHLGICPDSDQILQRSEMLRWAKSEHRR
jgi:hypothetical protein